MKLNVKVSGQGQPIVLLPGFGFKPSCFDQLLYYLEKQFQCYVISYSEVEQGEGLSEIVASLKSVIPDNANVLGWSLGGTIAIAFALAFPSVVRKLILLATNPRFIAEKDWPGMEQAKFNAFETQCYQDLSKALKQFSLLQMPLGQVQPSAIKKIRSHLWDPEYHQSTYQSLLAILKHGDLRKKLCYLTCHSLWLFAEHDQLVPISVISQLQKKLGTNSCIKQLDNQGHFFLDSTNRWDPKPIITFLEEIRC